MGLLTVAAWHVWRERHRCLLGQRTYLSVVLEMRWSSSNRFLGSVSSCVAATWLVPFVAVSSVVYDADWLGVSYGSTLYVHLEG